MKKMAKLFAVLAAMALALSFSACKNDDDDFEMTKPSEIAVSNLSAEVRYGYSNGYKYGEVNLTWFYDSADPAEYLVVYRTDNSDEIHTIDSGSLESFKTHSITDSGRNPGKYTYTVYTVGSGYSTSASASVTVNLEYSPVYKPNYNDGNGGSSSGGSGGSSSSGTVTYRCDEKYTNFTFSNGTFNIVNTLGGSMELYSGTYTGNPSSDGIVAITVTKMSGSDFQGVPTDISISNGQFDYAEMTFVRQ